MTTPCPATSQTLSLQNLPTELLLDIADNLCPLSEPDDTSYCSVLALRWTCRRLYSVVPRLPREWLFHLPNSWPRLRGGCRPMLRDDIFGKADLQISEEACARRSEKVEAKTSRESSACDLAAIITSALMEIERWPEYSSVRMENFASGERAGGTTQAFEDLQLARYAPRLPGQSYHTCRLCLRMRRTEEFHISQICDKRGKRMAALTRQGSSVRFSEICKRFCVDCGKKVGYYKPTTPIRVVRNPNDFIVSMSGGREEEATVGDASVVGVQKSNAEHQERSERSLAKKVLVNPAPALEIITAFICKRCYKLFEVPNVSASNQEDSTKGPLGSKEFLRKTCTACLQYRSPWARSESSIKM